MADHPLFSVSVVTPEGAAFDGDAEMLIVPGAAGEIGVLARHAPLVAMLNAGSTRVHLDAAGVERVAVRQAVHLLERVHREGAGPFEPELVARARERFQKGVAVAGGAVAEAGALLLVVERACVPDELGALEQQLLVQVTACM